MTDNTDHYAAQTPVLTAMLEYGSAIRGDDLKLLLRRMRAASVFVDPPGALTPLLDALEAVLKRHVAVYSCTDESWHSMETVPCDDCGEWCYCCGEAYPCVTVTAIHAALIGDDHE